MGRGGGTVRRTKSTVKRTPVAKKSAAKKPVAKKPAPASTKKPDTSKRTADKVTLSESSEPKARQGASEVSDALQEDLSAAREKDRRSDADRRQTDRREIQGDPPDGIERRQNADRRAEMNRRASTDRRGMADNSPGEEFDVKKNSLDLTKKQSVGGIKRAIDFMANENGEETKLGFHLEGAGRNGATKVGGWGDLGLKVSQSDTGSTVLGFNYEAAVKAGLDLKFLEIGGAVGVKGGIQARFKDSGHAAAWLGEGLHKFGEKTGLVDVQKQKFAYDKPTTVKANGFFGKGQFSTKFGPFELSGEAGVETVDKTFMKPDGTTQKGRETALTAGANRKIKIGDFEYDVNYNYKRSTITGDSNENNNGTYDNHQLGMQLSVANLKKMSPQQI